MSPSLGRCEDCLWLRTPGLASQDEDGGLLSEQQRQYPWSEDFKVNLFFIFKMLGQWVEISRGTSFQNPRWELELDNLNRANNATHIQ